MKDVDQLSVCLRWMVSGTESRDVHTSISPFLPLSLSLSVLRRAVPLLLARLRLRQTCYVITVGAQCGKFSVLTRVAATTDRALPKDCATTPVIYEQ
ncbi:unnamed protein product [Danaus chrysippus]|uniref:(African queen) hypothetical protein n=1 Tax=Danaus chrysippus TaxID=151541 RepID=A0A8J2R3L5_9NEOP|nr:unnamed protein product [Danaus chrysippus]